MAHRIWRPLVVGSLTVIGTGLITPLLTKNLSFIPSFNLVGLSVPHGVIAAGASAFIGAWIADKIKIDK